MNSQLPMVEMLVRCFASPAFRDNMGRTPLDLAVILRDAQPEKYALLGLLFASM